MYNSIGGTQPARAQHTSRRAVFHQRNKRERVVAPIPPIPPGTPIQHATTTTTNPPPPPPRTHHTHTHETNTGRAGGVSHTRGGVSQAHRRRTCPCGSTGELTQIWHKTIGEIPIFTPTRKHITGADAGPEAPSTEQQAYQDYIMGLDTVPDSSLESPDHAAANPETGNNAAAGPSAPPPVPPTPATMPRPKKNA